jgi:NDP-sugar pyrophosphorylase family protein
MRAFILAAGEGQRLRPLTTSKPKPMIELAGRPILEHNVRMLVRHGVRDLVINLHHHGETIREHFGDGARFGATIEYSEEPELLGTAGALNAVRGRFDAPFFLVYGDNASTLDLGRMTRHHQPGDLGTMAAYEREDVSQSGALSVDERDRIVAFEEKPPYHRSGWVNAGVLYFEPEIFAYVPPNGASDFGRDVLPAAMAAGKILRAYRMSEKLWWIDSLADYERTLRDEELRALMA